MDGSGEGQMSGEVKFSRGSNLKSTRTGVDKVKPKEGLSPLYRLTKEQ